MEITCPKCRKPSKHNEDFLGPKGSILRCSLCGSLVKIFNRGKSDEIGPAMWVVRKEGGKVMQVDRLSTLQRWILDGTVERKDELLRSGKGWMVLESVSELGGLLYLARLDEDARRAEMWKMPTLNMGDEAPAPAEKKKDDQKKAGTDTPEDEDTVQIPGKVLEESIKLSEADEIITAEIVLLDEEAGEEDEAREKRESESDEPPVMLVRKHALKKPGPRLEPVAEPPEPSKPAAPVLEIKGEVTEGPWSEEEDEKARPEAIRGSRRGVKMALQITLIVVLALVAGALYVHRDRVYEWRLIFFPPADKGAADGPARDASEAADGTAEAVEGAGAAAAGHEVEETDPLNGEGSSDDPETAEEGGKGGKSLKGYEEHYKKALALQHSGNCDRAIEFYRKAIEIDYRHAEAWTGIGECYEKQGKNLNAHNSFKSALHYNSKYGPALLGLAEVLKKMGKLEASLNYYNRYLETNPGGSRVASVRKTVEEIEAQLKGGGSADKKDPIGIPENPYGP